jgi:hypothetical protein
MGNKIKMLKEHFLAAIKKGKLGSVDDEGIVFTLKEFKKCFSHIKTDYINSFLPAATLEPGQFTLTRTKFLFRIRRGVYRVHNDLLEELKNETDS